MSEMVERVATLLYVEFAHPPREGEDLTARCERVALTAIEAMRETDMSMITAAVTAANKSGPGDFVAIWQAMIDATLNPDRTL